MALREAANNSGRRIVSAKHSDVLDVNRAVLQLLYNMGPHLYQPDGRRTPYLCFRKPRSSNPSIVRCIQPEHSDCPLLHAPTLHLVLCCTFTFRDHEGGPLSLLIATSTAPNA